MLLRKISRQQQQKESLHLLVKDEDVRKEITPAAPGYSFAGTVTMEATTTNREARPLMGLWGFIFSLPPLLRASHGPKHTLLRLPTDAARAGYARRV